MRTRTRQLVFDPIDWQNGIVRGANGVPGSVGNFNWIGQGLKGILDPSYRYQSTIIDTTSPPGKFQMNRVSHIKQEYANFAGNWQGNFTYSMDPGTPTLRFDFWDHGFCLDPYQVDTSVSTEKWGGLLDELASLAEGRVSDAAMLPVTLKELGQTIAMVRNPFSLLTPNWRKKGGKSPAFALAKRAANYWLEGYYGWNSAYQDVKTIAKATHSYLNTKAVRSFEESEAERLSVGATDKSFAQLEYSCGSTPANWAAGLAISPDRWDEFRITFYRLANVRRSKHYRISCRQDQEAHHAISSTRRLLRHAGANNWRDWRDCLWEVIPFSFVIDWFVDSRGIWKGLNEERLRRMDITNVTYSTKVEWLYDVDMFFPGPGYAWAMSGPWGGKKADQPSALCIHRTKHPGKFVKYDRYVGFPSAGLVDATLAVHGLKRIQCLNGAALLLQKLLT